MNPNDPNIAIVELAAKALGHLNERLVLVGGCATGLLITDRARPPVRATQDVDLIAEVSSLVEYYKLAGELRSLGFEEERDIICRWRLNELIVDVMPTDEAILGFSNRWYVRAIEQASLYTLPSGSVIRLISAPLLIASKLEAFHGRGAGDFGASHDIEDIVNVVDGRPEVVAEIAKADTDVRQYIKQEVEGLLGDPQFLERIPWHITPEAGADKRVEIVISRLRSIGGI